jgi:hypothetical protein
MPHRMRFLLGSAAALLLSVAVESSAFADDPFAWAMPSAEEQLEADHTVIPLGKGALFVPAMTDPYSEPPVIIVADNVYLTAATGQRVLLDPGQYVVIVTSGSPGQGVGVSVDINEGETTIAPVTWGALRVEVTDDRRVPHRGSYEIIKDDTREPYGTGFGADTLQGETLSTWLLPPGVYRIVRAGSNYRSFRDWSTVYVPEGGLVRYRLVTDPATGEFRGAGMLLPNEFGTMQDDRPWFASIVVGLDGTLAQASNVVGVQNGTTAALEAFGDAQIAWNKGPQHFASLVQLEEGATQFRPQAATPLPILKSKDRFRTDLLYTRYLREDVGPYVRAAGEAQIFPSEVLVTQRTDIRKVFANGNEDVTTVAANHTFHVSDAFEPTVIREGVGLNTRFFNSRLVSFNWRIGLGLRQNLYGGAFVLNDDPTSAEIEYEQVKSFTQQGAESTFIATLRLPGAVVYNTDLELFADFRAFNPQCPTQSGTDGVCSPSLEWRNTLTLRIARNLSLNYYMNYSHLPQVVDAPQFEQSLLFRASWALL